MSKPAKNRELQKVGRTNKRKSSKNPETLNLQGGTHSAGGGVKMHKKTTHVGPSREAVTDALLGMKI